MDKNLENLLEVYEKLVKVSEKIIDESEVLPENNYEKVKVPIYLLYELEEIINN